MSITTITVDLTPDVAETAKGAAVWDSPTLAAWDALLDSFRDGQAQDHRETVAALAQGLNDDRPSQRRVFGTGTNAAPIPDQSAE